MTTMLERVAEAQYAVLRDQAAGRLPPWAILEDHARALMLKQVRAGLEPMRQVSPAVERAGHLAMPIEFTLLQGGGVSLKPEGDCVKASAVLNALLDAILAEVPK